MATTGAHPKILHCLLSSRGIRRRPPCTLDRHASLYYVTGMNPKRPRQPVEDRWLNIDEVRVVSDVRIMHAKVDEVFHLVESLKERHDEGAIVKYADSRVLTQDIQRIDATYLWFVRLKEEIIAQRG
jgi:hypothetical protein